MDEEPEIETEMKWVGNETLFSIGETEVKIWQVVAGLIVMGFVVPMFMKKSKK
jgi:hypothetical protein